MEGEDRTLGGSSIRATLEREVGQLTRAEEYLRIHEEDEFRPSAAALNRIQQHLVAAKRQFDTLAIPDGLGYDKAELQGRALNAIAVLEHKMLRKPIKPCADEVPLEPWTRVLGDIKRAQDYLANHEDRATPMEYRLVRGIRSNLLGIRDQLDRIEIPERTGYSRDYLIVLTEQFLERLTRLEAKLRPPEQTSRNIKGEGDQFIGGVVTSVP